MSREVLVLTGREKWIRGRIDSLGLTIGYTTFLRDDNGELNSIPDERGEQVGITIFVEHKIYSTVIRELINNPQTTQE